MRVKVYIFLFVLLLSAGSCIREKCYNKSKADYHYLDPATLPWFGMFKDGSWWVYEEEKTGLRDSMYVKNYHHSFYGMGCEFREFNEGELISQYIFKKLARINYSLSSEDGSGFSICLDFYCFTPSSYNSETNKFKSHDIQKIILNGKSYDETIKVEGGIDFYMYFSKAVGIVRIEKDNKFYNLIKYEISQ